MSNQKISFPVASLRDRLALLSCERVVVFAASCAERLMPAYCRYSEKAKLNSERTLIFRDALDLIWNSVLGQKVDRQSIEEFGKACRDAIPSEDDAWRFGEPYAEDAGAAVTFTIRAWLSCDPQEAAWVAQRVYDAVDNFVGSSTNERAGSLNLTVVTHLLREKELARQEHYLVQLERSVAPAMEKKQVEELRARAQHEALSVFE